MSTTAEQISEQFENDGEVLISKDGVSLPDAAMAGGCCRILKHRTSPHQKFCFPDHSAIVIYSNGTNWDIAVSSDNDDCFCSDTVGCLCS